MKAALAAPTITDFQRDPSTSVSTGPAYVRRLHSGDENLLRRFFYSHTKQTVLLRYGYLIPTMSANRANRLVDVNENQGVGFGIFSKLQGNEILLAVGRYSVEADDIAEISFVVEESHRRRGYATTLLRELALAAQSHGITMFRAQVLRENFPMRRLLSQYKPTFDDDGISRSLDYIFEVSTVLKSPSPHISQLNEPK